MEVEKLLGIVLIGSAIITGCGGATTISNDTPQAEAEVETETEEELEVEEPVEFNPDINIVTDVYGPAPRYW